MCYNLVIRTTNQNAEAHSLEALAVAQKAVEVASDKQASDVVLLDTRGICSFADYFVICSGESTRQIKTIYEEVEHALKKEGILPHHHEGTLLIVGDIVERDDIRVMK